MKPFSTFIFILFLTAAIAKFTVPGSEKLNKIATQKETETSLKIKTVYTPGLLFSMGYLYYNNPKPLNNGITKRLVGTTDSITGKVIYSVDTTDRQPLIIQVPGKTEKYLGLFGTYWKL